mmetsp:Transcript_59837/g.126694  ORF Transcript_59837/g.126694 Transcript_59837/m.126694 type:complete len:297 (-) Transcript_59837:174-1064(-)
MVANLHHQAAIACIQGLHLLVGEGEVQGEVGLHPLLVDALGDRYVAFLHGPLYQDLSGQHSETLRRGLCCSQLHVRLSRAQCTIAHHCHTLGKAPLRQVGIAVGWVYLKLIHCRRDFGIIESIRDLQARPVGHPDGLCFSTLRQGLHVAPQSVAGNLGQLFLPRGGVHTNCRVHEVEVQILQLEILQGFAAGCIDLMPICGPELAHNEELFPLNLATRKNFCERLADLNFVTIDGSTIQAPVTSVNGCFQSLGAMFAGDLPKPEGNCRHGTSRVQSYCGHVGDCLCGFVRGLGGGG